VLADSDLAEVGARVTATMRAGDVVTHLGSGRFAMLLRGVSDFEVVRSLERRLDRAAVEALPRAARPSVVLATDFDLEPGSALRESLGALEEMLAEAAATHETVRSGIDRLGTGPVVPVTPESFRRALNEGQLRLHYQPVVDVNDQRAGGAEALLRWQHPTLGLLVPRHFLAMAELAVGAVPVGEWVMEQAVRQTAAWQAVTDLEYYRVGINLPPRVFLETDVAATMGRLLDRYGVAGDRFAIEILESEAMRSPGVVSHAILRLRAMGLRVALDDFGSGYATASRLRDLPVDLVKVDRTLVGLAPTATERALLAAVCSVARAMDADVLLEGVERPLQLEVARAAGVTFAQGMLVGPPGPPGLNPPRPLRLPSTG
jgi:EAL domain-containing protein (putative c-di-GMP-specific phosphodiesterase class I)